MARDTGPTPPPTRPRQSPPKIWMYQLRNPAPPLRPYLEHYGFVHGTGAAPLDLRVDVYVDGRADLVLPYGATYERTIIGGPTTRFEDPNLDMQRLDAFRIDQRGLRRTFDGQRMPFLADDVLVLPVANISLEELARYGVDALAGDGSALSGIEALWLTVEAGPGQRATWGLRRRT